MTSEYLGHTQKETKQVDRTCAAARLFSENSARKMTAREEGDREKCY